MKFYMHAGSFNHGCEAIVRSTLGLIKKRVILYSEHPEEDLAVGLDELCEVKHQGHTRDKMDPGFIFSKALETIVGSDIKFKYLYKNILNDAKPGDLYVSIGGDNYCYNNNPNLIYLNKCLNQKGCKTILWGCSIEPDLLVDPFLLEDLKRYLFISARETITYQSLLDAGLDSSKVKLFPDPAFTLHEKKCPLPDKMKNNDAVGINLSPLVNLLDKTGGNVYESYKRLVKYILDSTNLVIVLLPHVCKPGNDDRQILRKLRSEFASESRIVLVNENGLQTCEELKYIIARCRFIVAARTHASIAAYSNCVPTLVVGYSVKARGIAKDLFGEWSGKVIDISEMNNCDLLTNCFQNLLKNEKRERDFLTAIIPEYTKKAMTAGKLLTNVVYE